MALEAIVSVETLASWSQIIGVVGGLATLIFVGFQIRDNSKAVRAATAQSVHDNYASWYVALSSNESALATSVKGAADLDSLTPGEKMQFVCIFMAFLSHSQNAFHQWQAGHLSDGLWAGWEALLMNLVNTPGGVKFWAERDYLFGQDFQGHVAKVMARHPDPRAKGFGVVPVFYVSEGGGPDQSG